jgi:hypothetical protein
MPNRMTTRRIIDIIVIGVALGTAAWWVRKHQQLEYRNAEIERLFHESSGFDGSLDSVVLLGRIRGPKATAALMNLAKDAQNNPSVRENAIDFLSDSSGVNTTELSEILQPQEALDIRIAVIESLIKLGCDEGCVANVLHYEDRVLSGEQTADQLFGTLIEDTNLASAIQRKNEVMHEKLRMLIASNQLAVLNVLTRVYGLGGALPSPVVLQVARDMPNEAVCKLMKTSLKQRVEFYPKNADKITRSLNDFAETRCRKP